MTKFVGMGTIMRLFLKYAGKSLFHSGLASGGPVLQNVYEIFYVASRVSLGNPCEIFKTILSRCRARLVLLKKYLE